MSCTLVAQYIKRYWLPKTRHIWVYAMTVAQTLVKLNKLLRAFEYSYPIAAVILMLSLGLIGFIEPLADVVEADIIA